MKKTVCFLTVIILLFSLSSCRREENAYELISEFVELYRAEGVIYSPTLPEGSVGYIDDSVFFKIYIYYGDAPKNYAVFLNSHIDTSSECGAFVCLGESERAAVLEACSERIRLLTGADSGGLIITSSNIVFYSTMSDKEFTESCWKSVLRSHS